MFRIQGAIGLNAMRGTSFDATPACAATVADESRVWFDSYAKQNLCQQKPGSVMRIDETGVFADPAQPGALSEVALENGTGIGVITVRDRVTDLLFDENDKFP